MIIDFKNRKLYYHSVPGKDKPIVLLHGFLESSDIWDDFTEEFSQQRQVIRLDLPGHGQSETVAEVHPMELFAEAVDFVLQELKVVKVDLLGHSMGGYVALAFLERFPEKVNNIILLNSTTMADNEERRKNRDRSTELVCRNKDAFVRMAISNLLTPANNEKFRVETAILKERALEFPTDGISAALQGMKIRKDRTQVLKQFKGGKFILAGEEDPLLDFLEIKTLAEETDSSLHSFPDGHLSYLENRDELLKTVYYIE